MAEEYGDLFGGPDNWLRMYRKATRNKYDFLYMDLQSNTPVAYSNFDKVVGTGGFANSSSEEEEDEEIEPSK